MTLGDPTYDDVMQEHGFMEDPTLVDRNTTFKWWSAFATALVAILVAVLVVSNLLLWSQLSQAKSEAAKSQRVAKAAMTAAREPQTDYDGPSIDFTARNDVSNLRACVNDFLQGFTHYSPFASFQFHFCGGG